MVKPTPPEPIKLTEAQKLEAAYVIVFLTEPKYRQSEIKDDPHSRFNDAFVHKVLAFVDEPKNGKQLEDYFAPEEEAVATPELKTK